MLQEYLEDRKMNKILDIKRTLLDIRCLDIVIIFISVAIISNTLLALVASSIYALLEFQSSKRVDYIMFDIIGLVIG